MASAAPAATKGYIVVLKDDVVHPAYLAHRHEDNRGADVDHIYKFAIKGYSADLTSGELQAIEQDPNVDYVEPDRVTRVRAQYPSTAIPRVGAIGNPQLDIDEKDDAPINVDIAIIDTGIAPHRDLNIAGRTDCTNLSEGDACRDGHGVPSREWHGTHVAGIAAARDNAEGVVGSAPGARLWSVRVIDDEGNGSLSEEVAGVDWVTANASKIEVANMSIGCEFCDLPQALHDALTVSINAGVVYTVAAGNLGHNALEEGVDPQTIVVSAITDFDGAPGGKGTDWCNDWQEDDKLAGYSNFGSVIDIAAPGDCIRSTYLNGEYAWWHYLPEPGPISGTSMAAPLVAGAAAVLASQSNPENRADVERIRNSLRSQGSYDYVDTSGDGKKEPLLNMSSGFVLRSSAPTEEAPSVTTVAPTELTSSSAKLNGWVNPNGAATTYYIQYGPTTSYGATIHTPPGSPIGSGAAPIAVWNVLSGLEGETTFHYRVVAVNSWGTSYGTDQVFTTGPAVYGSPSVLLDQADDQTWVHSRNSTTGALEYNNWKSSTGWVPTNLETTMRGGSNPAAILDKTTKQQWVYYVEPGGTLNYWNWKNTWIHYSLGTMVKPNTSPAVAFDQSTKQQWVYYVGTDNQLKLWNWTQANGWVFYNLGSSIAPGTSPTVSYDEATQETSVYYVRSDMQIGQFRWTGATGWQQATLGASVRARTSPTVVLHQGSKQQWVYFVAADGALKYFNYNPAGGWKLFALSATVAPNTSPTAIIDPATYQQWVYYADPTGNIDYWNWTGANGWLPYSLSASVAQGTSVAVALDLTSKQQWVYYRQSGGAIRTWNWNGAAGGWKSY